jgi:hypothetical protein
VTIRLLAEAEAELDEAVAHYEALSAGLGAGFAADIRIGLALIEEYPDGWQLGLDNSWADAFVDIACGGFPLVWSMHRFNLKSSSWR